MAFACLVTTVAGLACCRLAEASARFRRTVGAQVLSVSDAGADQVNLHARLLDGTERHAAGDTVSVVASCSGALAERLRSGDTVDLDWRYSSTLVPASDGEGARGVEHESWRVVGLAPPGSERRRPASELGLSIPQSPRLTAPARPDQPLTADRSRVLRLVDEACEPGALPERLQQIRERMLDAGHDCETLLRADLNKVEDSLAGVAKWEKDAAEWWDQSRADKVALIRKLGQRRRAVLLDLIAVCMARSAKAPSVPYAAPWATPAPPAAVPADLAAVAGACRLNRERMTRALTGYQLDANTAVVVLSEGLVVQMVDSGYLLERGWACCPGTGRLLALGGSPQAVSCDVHGGPPSGP